MHPTTTTTTTTTKHSTVQCASALLIRSPRFTPGYCLHDTKLWCHGYTVTRWHAETTR